MQIGQNLIECKTDFIIMQNGFYQNEKWILLEFDNAKYFLIEYKMDSDRMQNGFRQNPKRILIESEKAKWIQI